MIVKTGYKKADVERLLDINRLCYSGIQLPPDSVFKSMLTICDVFQAKMFTLKDGTCPTIGFALVNPYSTGPYLWSLAIDPRYQKVGCGSRLLRYVCAHYTERGENHIRLHVHVDNGAQKLYFDNGFRVKEFAPNYYGLDAGLYMEKQLCSR